nr:MAG TPA: hypothetical protein [Caudoviricetes sp.]
MTLGDVLFIKPFLVWYSAYHSKESFICRPSRPSPHTDDKFCAIDLGRLKSPGL